MLDSHRETYRALGREDFEFHGIMKPNLMPVYGDALEAYTAGFEQAKRRGKRFVKISMREAVRIDKKNKRAYSSDHNTGPVIPRVMLTKGPRKLKLDGDDW